MFDNTTPLLEVAARAAIVYFAVLIGLRLGGKREMGQLTAFDLAVILLIANAVQNAMVGSDVSVTGGLVAAGVLLGLNYAVGFARERIPWLQETFEGKPTILVYDGKIIDKNMKSEGIDNDMIMMAVREHGLAEVERVHLAVLEVDGAISVVPKDEDGGRAPRRRTRFVRRGSS